MTGDEAEVWARRTLGQLYESEVCKLADAVRSRVSGRSRKSSYTLRIDLPETDALAGMFRPTATSRVSETGETRLLDSIDVGGQRVLPLATEPDEDEPI